MTQSRIVYVVACLMLAPLVGMAQPIPAFPGAEGAGAFATGGRPVEKLNYVTGANTPTLEKRGIVYHVTTLDPDPQGVIPGSLRYGLKTENFWYETHPFRSMDVNDPDSFDVTPRMIVFDVGGTIHLGEVDITPMNFTIAGQTAPGGITFYGGEFNPGHRAAWDQAGFYPKKTNNLVLRNFSVRTHDSMEKDGLWLPASNSIADHLSLSWYTDEGVSITDGASDVTVQHTIVGPGWNNPDGDGSQIEGYKAGAKISVHHNLYIHNDARIPRVGEKTLTTGGPGVELDFRNNVIYNWNDSRVGYGVAGENSFSNFVNNYYIGGAGSNSTTILNVPSGAAGQTHRVYQSGNLMDQNKNGVADGVDLGWNAFTGNEAQQAVPYTVPHGVTQTPAEALDTVMNYVGANWWDRHFLDDRAINQLMTFGNSSLPNSQRGQVLSTIDPADVAAVTGAPMQTRPPDWDTDGDGMPDWWEVRHGLDPSDSDDWKLDFDGDGYINIEEYINEIAEWPAPDDIVWTGGSGRFAEINNWSITRSAPEAADSTTHWQPSRFDVVVINDGVVEVDAVGQHAASVRIGTNAGDNGELVVSGGWLRVEQEIAIGTDDAATAAVSLNGGILSAGSMTMAAGGSFSFASGRLNADVVHFDLTNDGGTIAPGHDVARFRPNGPTVEDSSVGTTHVMGDLALNSGTVEIELASATDFDRLIVDGTAHLAGNLEVSLLGDFVPDPSHEFAVVTASSVLGTFLGASTKLNVSEGTFDVTYTSTAVLLSNFQPGAELPGDFNGDGLVDAADYTVWRDRGGSAQEFNDWRDNFGASGASGSAELAASIPEPMSFVLLILGMTPLVNLRWRRGQPK